MTREEAIKELQNSINVGLSPDVESRKMAIKALKAEPCEDCISREDAIKLVYKARRMNPIEGILVDTFSWAISFVNSVPSVKPERKKGKWIPVEDSDCWRGFECDQCKGGENRRTRFCPNCGVEMEV